MSSHSMQYDQYYFTWAGGEAGVMRGPGGYYWWTRKKFQRRASIVYRGPTDKETANHELTQYLKELKRNA